MCFLPYRIKLLFFSDSGTVTTEPTSLCGETPGVLAKPTELCRPERATLKLSCLRLSGALPWELLQTLEGCNHTPPPTPSQDGRVGPCFTREHTCLPSPSPGPLGPSVTATARPPKGHAQKRHEDPSSASSGSQATMQLQGPHLWVGSIHHQQPSGWVKRSKACMRSSPLSLSRWFPTWSTAADTQGRQTLQLQVTGALGFQTSSQGQFPGLTYRHWTVSSALPLPLLFLGKAMCPQRPQTHLTLRVGKPLAAASWDFHCLFAFYSVVWETLALSPRSVSSFSQPLNQQTCVAGALLGRSGN